MKVVMLISAEEGELREYTEFLEKREAKREKREKRRADELAGRARAAVVEGTRDAGEYQQTVLRTFGDNAFFQEFSEVFTLEEGVEPVSKEWLKDRFNVSSQQLTRELQKVGFKEVRRVAHWDRSPKQMRKRGYMLTLRM